MFETYYGLPGRPFQLTPDPAFFFNSTAHRMAVSYLLYGLGQGEGFIVLTGEVGAGKTTLLKHLLSQLHQAHYVAAEIDSSQLGADDLLRMVAISFGLAVTNDKASLLNTIRQFLLANHQQGRRGLLLIDEAQNLPFAALEELRMLSNFQCDGKSLLQSFLVGQPQFRDIIASADLEQLRQRVIASFHLGPMNESETASYIDHRLRTAGWRDDPTFANDCVASFFRHTDGMPRRINTLMSRVLLYGCLEERHHITGQMVDDVARDMNDERAKGTDSKIVANAEWMTLNEGIVHRLQRLDQRCSRQLTALTRTLALFATLVEQ